MNAIILSSGQELITGQTVDTNSAYLSRELAALGIATVAHWTVGDDRTAISEALLQSAQRADFVFMTGGLGPTEDDLARQALADALHVELVLDEQSLARIEEFFRQRGRAMTPPNRVQAMVPRGAHALRNDVGTAPGIVASLGDCRVFIMPGVPSEMRWIFEHVVSPLLPQGEGLITHRILHTFGQGESDLGGKIADLMRRDANPLVGTTVAAGMVSIRIVTKADTLAQATRLSDSMAAEIRARLGELVVGEGDDAMPQMLGQLLMRRNQTLATAESCTGGMIGEMLTAVSGSSAYYLGGIVSYSNEAKTALLGVEADLIARDGAVSESVAMAMAAGCRERLGSDWGLSVTGIAGPTGATESKQVGLVFIGVAGPGGVKGYRHVLPGDRQTVRLRASLTAMNYVRLALR